MSSYNVLILTGALQTTEGLLMQCKALSDYNNLMITLTDRSFLVAGHKMQNGQRKIFGKLIIRLYFPNDYNKRNPL